MSPRSYRGRHRLEIPARPRTVRRALAAIGLGAILTAGIITAAAAPAANAAPNTPAPTGCMSGYGGGFGGHRTCDSAIESDGWFTRCVETHVLGFGGTQCYRVDPNNMGSQHIPYRIPG